MPRTLTPDQARSLAAARKKIAGGRKPKPTPCPKCGALCDSARKALGHC